IKINSDKSAYNKMVPPSSLWNAEKWSDIHVEVFSSLQKTNRISFPKIEELFEFFNKTNLLYRIATQIQTLIKIGGWVPMINGLIEINKLKILFSNYIEEYKKTIKISADELRENSKNNAYHELIKYKNPNIILHGFSIISHIDLLNSSSI